MAAPIIKSGVTGFVEIRSKEAKKYSEFDSFYWIREYATLMYLWPYETENIIKYNEGAFVMHTNPETKEVRAYYEIVFPRYQHTLDDCKIYKDSSVIQILLDLFSALKFLHSKRIMHRDIKPTNIMVEDILNDNHSVKRAILIDFSHAIRMRAKTITLDKDVATYPYRAPEIFDYCNGKCSSYDYKSDIWSMGMVLFELITGKDARSAAHTDCEDAFSEFITKEPRMISILSKEYEKKKKDFTYTKIYFQWISLMLERDPDIRVSASDMYQVIYDFARKNNIPIIEPKNGDDIAVIPSYTPKSARMLIKQQELLSMCIHMTHIYKNRLGMHFAEESLRYVLQHLIKKETIDDTNYKDATLAVCSIIDAAIYDNVYDINFCRERVAEYGITKDGLSENLRRIIQKHDKDFFLLNVFSFNGMVAVDHIESRISRIKKLDMDSTKLGIASIGDLVDDKPSKTPRRTSVQYDSKSARKSAHRKTQSDVIGMLEVLRVT